MHRALYYLCCTSSCRQLSKERSYLYLRENSFEGNGAFQAWVCCDPWNRDYCVCKPKNDVEVIHFDTGPFEEKNQCMYVALMFLLLALTACIYLCQL